MDIRIAKMYFANARILWHRIYPVLHRYANVGDVGPEQLAPPGPGLCRLFGDPDPAPHAIDRAAS